MSESIGKLKESLDKAERLLQSMEEAVNARDFDMVEALATLYSTRNAVETLSAAVRLLDQVQMTPRSRFDWDAKIQEFLSSPRPEAGGYM